MNSSNFTSNDSQSSPPPYGMIISVYVRFWLYLIPNVLSVLCSIFVLYHLLFDRTLRQALHNHVLIILVFAGLIYELTTVPLMLHYYYFGITWTITSKFSRFWTFIDSLCYEIQLIGFAWISVERHILIFHSQWVATKKKRFFVHYLPLIAILAYCFTYYFVFDLFPFCGDLNLPSATNGVPFSCISFHPIMGKWDSIINQIIPTFIIIIFSPALLVRVLIQKARLNQSIDWKKQQKMTIQLLSISGLYLFFNLPRTILLLIFLTGYSSDILINYLINLAFYAIYTLFIFPFVCCGSMPEIGTKLQKLFFCCKQQQVNVPGNVIITSAVNRRTVETRTAAH